MLFKFLKDVSTLILYTPLDTLTLNHDISFEIDSSIYFIKWNENDPIPVRTGPYNFSPLFLWAGDCKVNCRAFCFSFFFVEKKKIIIDGSSMLPFHMVPTGKGIRGDYQGHITHLMHAKSFNRKGRSPFARPFHTVIAVRWLKSACGFFVITQKWLF